MSLDPRVWSAAVAVLVEANRRDPRAPLDPELFVACVARDAVGSDPWTELTRASSLRRYLLRVRAIIGQLRREIKSEIRRIRRMVEKTGSLDQVLLDSSGKVTAIARYLVAIGEEREDLAERLRPDAEHQHWACPFYREATIRLFPEGTYPVACEIAETHRRPIHAAFSLN